MDKNEQFYKAEFKFLRFQATAASNYNCDKNF